MKKIILVMLTVFSINCLAQEKTTKTFTLFVKGNCEQCKKRIENSADIKGVKLCVWDEEKQSVTVTYRADKVSPEDIEKAIAESGHDAGNSKAKLDNYNKLPACCKYRNNKCEDSKK
jgi:periplasmic mercuric ion binding protein